MYGYVLGWYVLVYIIFVIYCKYCYVLACTDIWYVQVLACFDLFLHVLYILYVLIGISLYWYVSMCIGMYCLYWYVPISMVKVCISRYLYVFVCIVHMYVLYVLASICLYWNVHVSIRMYHTYLYVLACIACNGLYLHAVLVMSLRKVTLLGSNLASVTDLKRIETPHSLCCDFGGYKTFTTRWSGGTVQVWVQVWAPACHLAISPKAVPEGNRKFRGQNQLPSSWSRSQALLVRLASTDTGSFLVCCSRCWQRQALLRKTCYHSCDTDLVQESTRFWCFVNFRLLLVTFFFMWNETSMELARSCCLPKQHPSLCSIFLSFSGLWVETWLYYDIGKKQHVLNRILCKAAGLNQRPVRGKGVCSDLNWTAQQLQMAESKSLETMSGVILNWLQPKFAAKSRANEIRSLKAM